MTLRNSLAPQVLSGFHLLLTTVAALLQSEFEAFVPFASVVHRLQSKLDLD